MKHLIAIVVALFFFGCGAPRQDENLPSTIDSYQVGETVYVCGCPMMCCNYMSRKPEGRCFCNMPLRKGVVSKIHENIVIVTVWGREKIIYLKNR
jgi:hypothetical protein